MRIEGDVMGRMERIGAFVRKRMPLLALTDDEMLRLVIQSLLDHPRRAQTDIVFLPDQELAQMVEEMMLRPQGTLPGEIPRPVRYPLTPYVSSEIEGFGEFVGLMDIVGMALTPGAEQPKLFLTGPYREIIYLEPSRGNNIRLVAVFDTFHCAAELGKRVRSRFGFAPSVVNLRYAQYFEEATRYGLVGFGGTYRFIYEGTPEMQELMQACCNKIKDTG
jgi:hypothetical protein